MTHPASVPLLFLVVAAVTFAGCSQSPEQPASNESSATFQSGVSEVIALRDRIRDGFASGDVDAAHEPLHEVGAQLTQLPDLAAASNLSDAEAKEVSAAVEQLMDAFGAVDKTLHGHDGSTYEEEADTIDAGIAVLARCAGIELEVGETEQPDSSDTPDEQQPLPDVEEVIVPEEPEPVDAVEPVDAPE